MVAVVVGVVVAVGVVVGVVVGVGVVVVISSPARPLQWPEDWPPEVRRYVAVLAVQKLVELHDGYAGAVEFLYRGQGNWNARIGTIWPQLVADAAAFEAERQAAKGPVA